MGLALYRGIRRRYPDWRYMIDGDGGDENLKDYPIEENPELTIQSVVNNLMLYHEGWGVGRIKHSLTYSGGLSRSYTRTYASSTHHGFGVTRVEHRRPHIRLRLRVVRPDELQLIAICVINRAHVHATGKRTTIDGEWIGPDDKRRVAGHCAVQIADTRLGMHFMQDG